ncbi:MAG TPA: choice-of-anchor D domain-containing protein [Bryobacteraceae bacterium]|nr:choice-of-anchor D domain-containing protein [Bryobacteraceae bacterium]
MTRTTSSKKSLLAVLPGSHLLLSFGLLLATALPGMAQQNVFGCPVHPSNSVFYARIDSLPVLSQSATYTANMSGMALTWDAGFGVTLSDSSAPTIQAQFYYTPAYNGTWRYPAYYTVDRQGGALGGNDGADHHTIVVDSDTCTIWETYHAYVNPVDGSIKPAACGSKTCNAQSGWKYDATSSALPSQGTTDAAGLPLLPLIWRGHEIMDGSIQHAVRFTMARGYIQAGNPIWPASGTNGWGNANNPPYGARFRLKAGTAISLSGLTAQQQAYANTIIAGLQQYGLILADVGTSMVAEVDDEAGENPDIMTALSKVGSQIHPAQLEAVDLSSLKPVNPSYQVAGSAPSSTPVLVGTPSTYLNIQAGMTTQMTAWVSGPASTQAVTWQVLSGNIGTVTSDGLYTPPSEVSTITTGVLQATSVADPSATATVYVRVLPSGAIRIAGGIRSGTVTDKLGQVWQPNLIFRGGAVYHAGDNPAWALPNNVTQAAQMSIYQGYFYSYGNDLYTQIVVPNGTYNVRFMFGQPYNGGSAQTCSPFPATWHDYVSLELQNTIQVSNFDFGASIGHACAVPVDVNLTATVTNNVLEIALRGSVPDGAPTTSPMLNGLEITPSSGSPTGTPQVTLSTNSLNFGAQAIGSKTAPQVVTVSNTGTAPLHVSGVTLQGANPTDFGVTHNCGSVPANGSCTVSVTFTASNSGTRNAAVVIANTVSSPQVTVTGSGGSPKISFSENVVHFSNQTVGTTSTALNLTLTNSGTAALNLAAPTLTGARAADFAIASNGCTAALNPGGTCSLALTFSPKAFGVRSATLNLTNSASWKQSVQISGRGTALNYPAEWRPSTGTWYLLPNGVPSVKQWGVPTDIPVTGDFDGDGKPDIAVWRPSNGTWYVVPSKTGQAYSHQWGANGDIPVPGDYDGDGITDFAVWRPSTGTWWVIPSSTGFAYSHQWGLPGDIPVPGDYDGDGKTDYAIWRADGGMWWVIPSSTGFAYTHQWGAKGDIPVPGDYDGDGKTDYAVWRPNGGMWWIIPSTTGFAYSHQWGANGDIPVPGDFDGDGKTDYGVWRPDGGNWYVIPSTTGVPWIHQWGAKGDVPMKNFIN